MNDRQIEKNHRSHYLAMTTSFWKLNVVFVCDKLLFVAVLILLVLQTSCEYLHINTLENYILYIIHPLRTWWHATNADTSQRTYHCNVFDQQVVLTLVERASRLLCWDSWLILGERSLNEKWQMIQRRNGFKFAKHSQIHLHSNDRLSWSTDFTSCNLKSSSSFSRARNYDKIFF